MISECFRTLTVLPFRFGTIFDSDEALRRAVRANRKTFLETVARLRGKAEMHFKLLLKDGTLQEAIAELPNGVGGEYLRKLREQATRDRERQTKARALSMQVHKLFSPLEEDVICKRTDSGGMLIDFAHLIDSTSVLNIRTATAPPPGISKIATSPSRDHGRPITSCRASCVRSPAAI